MLAYNLFLFVSATLASPLMHIRATAGDIIPGQYIVTLKTSATSATLAQTLRKANQVKSVFNSTLAANGFHGFAAKLNTTQLAAVTSDTTVQSVEPDRVVTIQTYTTETSSPWGLARISHNVNGTTYGNSYYYDSSAGTGTCAYILDTGITANHPDFGGRASMLANFIDNSTADGNGHGTHVAGIIGSKTYGVAKSAKLYSVKVLGSDGSGSLSGVITGIDWAANDATKARNNGTCPKGTVGNMSLAGSTSTALNNAVKAAVNAGLFFAVAAGNSNAPASQYSPASETTACTVAASDENNARASFSNYGTPVKVFAPGTNIVSTWNNGGTASLSGTSMASPHVAGLAAYFFGLSTTPSASRTGPNMCAYIQSVALKNIVKDSSQSAVGDLLAYNADGK